MSILPQAAEWPKGVLIAKVLRFKVSKDLGTLSMPATLNNIRGFCSRSTSGPPIRRILTAKLFAARISLLPLGPWLLVFVQPIIG